MNCRSVEKWVWGHGTGNLPVDLAHHTQSCADCRLFLTAVGRIDAAVSDAAVYEPHEAYWKGFAGRVMSRLETPSQTVIRTTPVAPWQWAWKWAPAIGVAVLAVFIGRELLRQGPSLPVIDETAVRVEPATPSPRGVVARESVEPGVNLTAKPVEVGASAGSTATTPKTQREGPALKPDATAQHPESAGGTIATMPPPTISGGTESATTDRTHQSASANDDSLWPEREVVIMGDVSADTPGKPVTDGRRLAGQDPFGSYERQVSHNGIASETAGVQPVPGPLAEAPRTSPSGWSIDSQSPTEAMRRFDEIDELRRLIRELEGTSVAGLSADQRRDWCAYWYRLGMIAPDAMVVDSALGVVDGCLTAQSGDEITARDWSLKHEELQRRLQTLRR